MKRYATIMGMSLIATIGGLVALSIVAAIVELVRASVGQPITSVVLFVTAWLLCTVIFIGINGDE